MRIRQQRAFVELLRAGRHVDCRVTCEEIDGLEADFEDFDWHYGEVFDAWDLCVCDVVSGGVWAEGSSGILRG